MTDQIFEIDKGVRGFINAQVDPETGEILDEKALAEFEALDMDRKEKLRNVVLYTKVLDGELDVIDKEIDRLKRLKESRGNEQAKMKYLIQRSMSDHNETEIGFETCGVKIKKCPARLVIDDPSGLGEYTVVATVKSIDKNAIKKDMKDGKKVKGCRLERGERVDIY